MLGFIPRTTWPAGNTSAEDDVRARLRGALVDGTTPTERTVALIALLQVTGLLTKVLPGADKKLVKARAKELTEGDWAAKAVKDAIDEVAAATTAAGCGTARPARPAAARSPRRPGPGRRTRRPGWQASRGRSARWDWARSTVGRRRDPPAARRLGPSAGRRRSGTR